MCLRIYRQRRTRLLDGMHLCAVSRGRWSRLFVGDPEEILTDKGIAHTSGEFQTFCSLHSIQLRHTPTGQHNSLGTDEGYHRPLRKVFLKLRSQNLVVHKKMLLQLSVMP